MIHGNCKSQKNSLKQRLFFDAKSVFWHKNTLPCASFVNLGVFAIFSFNVCTEAVSVSPFVNLQWMATQCLFSLCLKQLLQAKTAQKCIQKNRFWLLPFCLPADDCNFTKFQWGTTNSKKWVHFLRCLLWLRHGRPKQDRKAFRPWDGQENRR